MTTKNGATLQYTLAETKRLVGNSLYSQCAAPLIADWQRTHNNPLLAEVLEGRTTFHDAFLPLAKANFDIDAKNGTDATFDEIAASTKTAFGNIMKLEARVLVDGKPHDADLTSPIPGTRRERKENLRMIAMINGSAGAALVAFLYFILMPDYRWQIIAGTIAALVLLSAFEIWVWSFSKFWAKARGAGVEAVSKKVVELDSLIPKSA